jgi:hypothetical protein
MHNSEDFMAGTDAEADATILDERALNELFRHDLMASDADDLGNLFVEKESLQENDDTSAMDVVAPEPETKQGHLTGRCPTMLYLSCDPENLSEYQCLIRKQIELFEANETDMQAGAQGRNKPIVLGQVCCTLASSGGTAVAPLLLHSATPYCYRLSSSRLTSSIHGFPPQVGIRCRHCAFVPLSSRGRSAVFYPSKLINVYQASQVR